jgi:hypothetical protein
MPRDKDRKRIIRNRMTKTGESYTTARSHIIAQPRIRQATTPAVDHAALAGMSDEKIAASTGRPWREWVRVLDADGAQSMPHRDIAALVHTRYRVGDWWAQTVTVGYERIKGLRALGQRRGQGYEAGKSKTFNVPVSVLFEAWSDERTRRRWLGGAGARVRTATAPKTIRLQWSDGTVVIAWFMAKADAKSTVTVAHTKLPDKAAFDAAKSYWTERLDALASLLATRAA